MIVHWNNVICLHSFKQKKHVISFHCQELCTYIPPGSRFFRFFDLLTLISFPVEIAFFLSFFGNFSLYLARLVLQWVNYACSFYSVEPSCDDSYKAGSRFCHFFSLDWIYSPWFHFLYIEITEFLLSLIKSFIFYLGKLLQWVN